MAERVQVEALLHSEFGLQRLSRVGENEFSRVSLLPREAPQSNVIVWRDGEFGVESHRFRDRPELVRRLTSGDRFLVGSTEVRFECITRRFASPHLQVVSLPGFPEREPLPSVREGLTVDRRTR